MVLTAKQIRRQRYYAKDRASYAAKVAVKRHKKLMDDARGNIASLCDAAARTALDCALAARFYADIRPCLFNPHGECKEPAECLLVFGRVGYLEEFPAFDPSHECDTPCWGLPPRPVLYGLKKLQADADFAATKCNWQEKLGAINSQNSQEPEEEVDIMNEV